MNTEVDLLDLLDLLAGDSNEPKWTERDMLDLLALKLASEAQGNGGNRWILAEHVRSKAGFDAPRVADAIAIDTWPSKGLELHGFEVKVSRSDWLTELRQPEKSEPFRRFCDRWWLVVPDRQIVRAGELPDGWGLMAMRGHGLARIRSAPLMADRDPVSRDLLACLMRSASLTARRRA